MSNKLLISTCNFVLCKQCLIVVNLKKILRARKILQEMALYSVENPAKQESQIKLEVSVCIIAHITAAVTDCRTRRA